MATEVQETRPAGKWLDALKLSHKSQKTWETRGEKIVKRYRDDRGMNGESEDKSTGDRYNILWSNVRTLFPAVYGRKPQAEAERRHKDSDPIGRTAAQILERALQYEIDHYPDYDASIRNAVLDRLLPGRGVVWVRYENTAISGQVTDDTEDPEEVEEPEYEAGKDCSPCDYVFWKDFRHSPARTWEEITWVARRVYMSREEGNKRFGEEKFNNAPLAHEPVGLDDLKDTDAESMKKAVVWEIWDKKEKKVIWVSEGCQTILDEKSDTLNLDNFFPCPKPLYSTLTTDTLIPVADYIMYQDQARELDTITQRITSLVSACKVVGVYDATNTALARVLNDGVENTMIPVSTWAAFGEKGGMKGAMDFLPLDMVIQTIQQLYVAREACKQIIYEVTGISDIIRGASNAQETARAQEIKSQYGSMRLKDIQNDVARFVSDLLRIKAQIMSEFYSAETLIEISGIQYTMDGQDPKLVEQAIQLIQNESLRNFRIEVASDSLIEIDEQGEKQSRMEFLAAAGGFIEKAIQAPPTLAPLLGEMLMFGVRGFKAGRPIEAAFDEFMQQMKQPKEPQPDPEQLKLQAEQQAEQQRMAMEQQNEQARLQAEMQMEQVRQQNQMQLEQQRMQFESNLENERAQRDMALQQMQSNMDAQLEAFKARLDASTKIAVAEIGAETTLTVQQDAAADAASKTE